MYIISGFANLMAHEGVIVENMQGQERAIRAAVIVCGYCCVLEDAHSSVYTS